MRKITILTMLIVLSLSTFCQKKLYSLESMSKVSFEDSSTKRWNESNKYLTAKFHIIANESSINDEFFKGNWAKVLTYFYVNVDVVHQGLEADENKLNFPLFYFDTKKNKSKKVESERVLNRLPVRANSRKQPSITINYQAVEESRLKDFSDLFDKGIKAISGISGGIALNPASLATINSISSITKEFIPPPKDYSSSIRIDIPEFNSQSNVLVRLFLIVPPYKEKNQYLYDAEMARTFVIKRDATSKSLIAFVDNKPYNTLPYVIVEFSPDSYVDDKDNLFVSDFSANCIFDQDKISKVSEFLRKPISTDLLTDEQHRLEEDLLECIKYLQVFNDFSTQLTATTDDTKKAEINIDFIDKYIKYSDFIERIDTTKYIYSYYSDRIKAVKSCIKDLLKPEKGFIVNISTLDLFRETINEFPSDLPHGAQEQEALLVANNQVAQNLTIRNIPLRRSLLYDKASININRIESVIYTSRFEEKVNALKFCNGTVAQLNTLNAELLSEQYKTQCQYCKDQLEIARASCITATNQNLKNLVDQLKLELSDLRFNLKNIIQTPTLISNTDTLTRGKYIVEANILVNEIQSELNSTEVPNTPALLEGKITRLKNLTSRVSILTENLKKL